MSRWEVSIITVADEDHFVKLVGNEEHGVMIQSILIGCLNLLHKITQ